MGTLEFMVFTPKNWPDIGDKRVKVSLPRSEKSLENFKQYLSKSIMDIAVMGDGVLLYPSEFKLYWKEISGNGWKQINNMKELKDVEGYQVYVEGPLMKLNGEDISVVDDEEPSVDGGGKYSRMISRKRSTRKRRTTKGNIKRRSTKKLTKRRRKRTRK